MPKKTSREEEKLDLVRPLPTWAAQYRTHPLDDHGLCVLVVKEKHSTAYYMITDEAQLHATALDIVKQRYALDHVYGREADVEEAKKERAEAIAHYNALKKETEGVQSETLRTAGMAELELLRHRIRDDVVFIQHHEMAKKAVETNNGMLAWMLLDERAEYEYENVRIEHLSKVISRCPRPSDPFHGQCWVNEVGTRWVYDERTLRQWIPRIYAQVFYNVQKAQGVDPIVRMRDEAQAYDKIPDATQDSEHDVDV